MVSAPLVRAWHRQRQQGSAAALDAAAARVAHDRERTSRAAEAEFDTTLPRFDVMAALYRSPEGMLMSDLSRFLLVSNGNVTGIVDRLVSDGFVARAQREGDRRTTHRAPHRSRRGDIPRRWRRA